MEPAPGPVPRRFSSFDRVVGLVLLGFFLLAALLIWRGDRVGVQPVTVSPAEGAVDVSSQTPIQVTFSQPVVAQDNSPFQISPAVSGTVNWQGETVTFRPAAPLTADTTYTVTLRAGIQGQQGRELLQAYQWQFHTGWPRILYIAWEGDGVDQLFATTLGSRERRQLTAEAHNVLDFAPSPDGLTIVYTVLRADGGSNLWQINNDGDDRRLLLDCPGLACSRPVWSPDGRRIVYEQRRFSETGGPPGPPRLWWLDLATGETAAVFQDSQWLGLGARFSPNGRWIAYASSLSQEIQAYDLETGTTYLLLSQTGEPPAWSPDGDAFLITRLALMEGSYGTHIVQVLLEDGAETNLTGERLVHDSTPEWSPDGRWIAYSRKEPMTRDGRQIWLMRADGREARPLTAEPDVNFREPHWAPDSRLLLVEWYAMLDPEAEPTIGLLDIETGELRPIAAPAIEPGWVP